MNQKQMIVGKVKYPTREVRDDCSIGFLMDAASLPKEQADLYEKKWFNYFGEDNPEGIKKLEEVRNVLKGAKIKFFYDGVAVSDLEILSKPEEEKKGFSDDLTSFEDLLNDAHKKGLTNIFTIKEEINVKEKYALFKAVVIMADKKGNKKEFQAHGDATSENITGSFIKPHFIRMAETRAISRALRWATNNAKTAIEETDQTESK